MIRRSDGSALYNLAVAVDDRDMGITHVVRGEDHISNTPRQVMILRALGEEPPAYAHLPLLHGPDGKKLSKRHGAASVQELRAAGYLPEAVRNYIALLGWGYDESTTFFTTEELIERFDLARVSKNPAVFDEQKLRWMNGRYLRELPVEELRRGSSSSPAASCRPRRWRSARTRCRRSPTSGRWRASWSSAATSTSRPGRKVMGDGAAERLRAAREALEQAEPFDVETSSGRCAAWSSASTSSPRTSSSPCAWRSPAPRSRRASSSRWPRWAARRRSRASILRSQQAAGALSPPTLKRWSAAADSQG